MWYFIVPVLALIAGYAFRGLWRRLIGKADVAVVNEAKRVETDIKAKL
jgi:hypothetical protein